MRLQNRQRFTILLVLAGFALRAVAPLGYMPSTFGSGFLFELCPDQLPAGFSFASASASYHHHHHDPADSDAPANSADLCDFGHLLTSVVGVDSPTIDLVDVTPTVVFIPTAHRTPALATLRAYLSRAPPA